MKNKVILSLITSLIITNVVSADFTYSEPADFTGEAFFSMPGAEPKETKTVEREEKGTIPPIKKLRLKLKNNAKKRELINTEYAPTPKDVYAGEVDTSEYASKDLEEDFDDETLAPDGFEADEEAIAEEAEKQKKSKIKKSKKDIKIEPTEDIILDCENVDYDAPNYLVYAKGNVNVRFVKQKIDVKADVITFDRMNNTIKAEGNVRIIKGGQTITGDYIFVDMNEENALIENPLTRTATMEIKSQKGYVYGDKIVQEKGNLIIDESYPIELRSGNRGPKTRRMLVPKNETFTDDIEKGIIKLVAQDIKITQKGDLEVIALKKARVFKGDKTIFKTPAIKLYTNKNRDYGETDHWEVGSFRGLGMYAGPGFVFELPKGSVLKAMPILNYKSDFGIGAMTRFSSGTNRTMASYGSAMDKFFVLGTQKLDDKLTLEYSMNSYLNEWFLGRRRPKYGASLVYRTGCSSDNFLLKGKTSSFAQRVDAGYYHDLDFDNNFERIKGHDLGTPRFRYMAMASQDFYKHKNEEKLTEFSLGAVSQLSAALYGTGDTQVIGRVGPRIHTQYKRWMQDIIYFVSAYDDNTPMPVFDAFRYGKQNIYLREYFRINRYLTLAWFTSINLTNDSPNGRDFQENSFYISVGPEDIKMNLGYDFVRENLYCIFDIMIDAKGTKVEYDTLEIKQDKKAENKKKDANQKQTTTFETVQAAPVLQRAVVENVKVTEDVL